MINDVDNITHYNTNHRKFLLIFILFMTLLFGIIYFLKDRIPDINILIKMILFFVIISYLKNDKISLSDEALVFTYGYIPYLKIRRNYKFDKIYRISVVSYS